MYKTLNEKDSCLPTPIKGDFIDTKCLCDYERIFLTNDFLHFASFREGTEIMHAVKCLTAITFSVRALWEWKKYQKQG